MKNQVGIGKCFGVISAIAAYPLVLNSPAYAQNVVIPDATLGNEPSEVINDVPIDGLPADLITGGASRGQNLFHSFSEFNIGDSGRVYFDNPIDIQNILSRVTGNNPSNILGTLGVDGPANLFLLNPNGILFGPNASLDLNGSFTATTASAIQFDNQGLFSALEPESPPQVLSINPSAFLFNRLPVGNIVSESIAINVSNPSQLGLSVPNQESITLLGGDIRVDGLRAGGGIRAFRTNLVSVSGIGTVNFNSDGNIVFQEDIERGDVLLENEAGIIAFDTGIGNISIYAKNIDLLGNSFLLTGSREDIINASNIPPGSIVLDVTENIRVLGGSAIRNNVSPGAPDNGGDIIINTSSLLVSDGAVIGADVLSLGTDSLGRGDGGSLRITASDTIEINGVAEGGFPVSSALTTQTTGEGNAGNLIIETKDLYVRNGAQIGVGSLTGATRGNGDGGNLSISTTGVVEVSGFASNNIPFIMLPDVPSGIYGDTTGLGNAGNLFVEAQNLIVENGGQIAAGTFGEGDGGAVNLEILESIQLVGGGTIGQPNTGLFIGTAGEGAGGFLSIETQQLLTSGGAQISGISFEEATGVGGNLSTETKVVAPD